MKRISRQYDQSLNPIYLVACIYSYVAQTWYEPLVSVSGSCNRTSTSSSSRLSIKSDDLTVITFLALPSILTSNTIRAAGRNSWERKQEMPLSYITCTWCMAHTRNMDLLPLFPIKGKFKISCWKHEPNCAIISIYMNLIIDYIIMQLNTCYTFNVLVMKEYPLCETVAWQYCVDQCALYSINHKDESL